MRSGSGRERTPRARSGRSTAAPEELALAVAATASSEAAQPAAGPQLSSMADDDEPMEVSLRDEGGEEGDDEIAAAIGTKLPHETFQHIKKLHGELEKDLVALLKARARRASLDGDVQSLESGRLPSGMPPYKMKFTPPEAEVLSKEDIKFELIIPKGTSYLDCKSMIHMRSVLWNKKVDVLINDEQQEAMLAATAYDLFVDKAVARSTRELQRLKLLGYERHLG